MSKAASTKRVAKSNIARSPTTSQTQPPSQPQPQPPSQPQPQLPSQPQPQPQPQSYSQAHSPPQRTSPSNVSSVRSSNSGIPPSSGGITTSGSEAEISRTASENTDDADEAPQISGVNGIKTTTAAASDLEVEATRSETAPQEDLDKERDSRGEEGEGPEREIPGEEMDEDEDLLGVAIQDSVEDSPQRPSVESCDVNSLEMNQMDVESEDFEDDFQAKRGSEGDRAEERDEERDLERIDEGEEVGSFMDIDESGSQSKLLEKALEEDSEGDERGNQSEEEGERESEVAGSDGDACAVVPTQESEGPGGPEIEIENENENESKGDEQVEATLEDNGGAESPMVELTGKSNLEEERGSPFVDWREEESEEGERESGESALLEAAVAVPEQEEMKALVDEDIDMSLELAHD